MLYLLFRRGYWTAQLLAGMGLPKSLTHIADWTTKRSWVVCRMFFMRPCTGKVCPLCAPPPAITPIRRGYHTVMTWMDDTEGAKLMVDPVFEDLPSWVFLELPLITDNDAWRFWTERVADKTHNTLGWATNFLPRWLVKACGISDTSYHGLATPDDADPHADSWFCSEMMTALVQQQHYKLGLVPCRTTPQQLFDALRTTHPHLATHRFRSKHAVAGKPPISGGDSIKMKQLLIRV